MEIKLRLACKALVTAFERTLEGLVRYVCQLMILKMALREERLSTTFFGASVHPVSLRLEAGSLVWSVFAYMNSLVLEK